jgi:Ca-activated chloride channel family protein
VIHTVGIGDPDTTGEDKVDLDALQHISDITGGRSFHALGNPQELADVYTTLDKMTPEKVKREIYRPQRDFFWIPLAAALSILTLYHCLALLIAVLRAPSQKQAPKTMDMDGVGHGN